MLPYEQHKSTLMCYGFAEREQSLSRCLLPYAVNAKNKSFLHARLQAASIAKWLLARAWLSCMKSEVPHSLISPNATSSKTHANNVAADTGGAEAT